MIANITTNITNATFPREAIHPRFYAYASLTGLNSFLHAFGFILLLSTLRQKKTPQHLYLLNLSLIECLNNICQTVMFTGGILYGFGPDSEVPWVPVTISVYFALTLYLYWSIMFLITADRLLATLLHIRYKSVCTFRRVAVSLCVMWVFCLTASIIILAYNYTAKGTLWIYPLWGVYAHYVHLVLASMYLFSAVVSYSIMFVSYIRSRRRTISVSPTDDESQPSTFQLFRRSKFYISLLLITSFLVFMLIPWMILTITEENLPPLVVMVLVLSTSFSDTLDFFIYVFFYRPVYQWFKGFSKTVTSQNSRSSDTVSDVTNVTETET